MPETIPWADCGRMFPLVGISPTTEELRSLIPDHESFEDQTPQELGGQEVPVINPQGNPLGF